MGTSVVCEVAYLGIAVEYNFDSTHHCLNL